MGGLVALLAGLGFGVGLIVSGMANPAKVRGFLDITGAWDPSLAFVMMGAIAVCLFGFRAAQRRAGAGRPSWCGAPIDIPTQQRIDARLIGGGALFGVGWGLAGFCPGPALVALGSGFEPALWFVPTMLAGMWLADRLFAPVPSAGGPVSPATPRS